MGLIGNKPVPEPMVGRSTDECMYHEKASISSILSERR